MDEIEAGVPTEFSSSPDQVPTYVNVIAVKEVSGAVFLEFGFFDTTSFTEELAEKLQKEGRALEVKLLLRLVLSKETATELIAQLQQLLSGVPE